MGYEQFYVVSQSSKKYIDRRVLPRFTPEEVERLKEAAKELDKLLGGEPYHPDLLKLMEVRNAKITAAHKLLWESTKRKGLKYHADEDLQIYHAAVDSTYNEFENSPVPAGALLR